LKALAKTVIDAKKKAKLVIVMMGGNVIKTGCCPILADLAAGFTDKIKIFHLLLMNRFALRIRQQKLYSLIEQLLILKELQIYYEKCKRK